MSARRHTRWIVVGVGTVAVLLMMALAERPVGAQVVGGSIGGTITDDTGGALPGTTVTVTNRANGATQVVTTGERGNYRAVALQPAPYTIAADISGFAVQKRDVVLTIGSDLTIDFKLGVASVAETLTVVAETPLVEVAKSQPSSVIVAEQVAALPVLARNFLTLAQLMPSTAPNNLGQKFAIIQFGGPADQRNGYTTIIDGGDIDDAIWGNPTINIPQDAVQEFKVFRNQFDAEYGSALAAVVSVVTKSGGNLFSGTGSYFGRDKALNAPNYFAAGPNPEFSQTRVGGTLGGPIVRNRTHFFGSYEHNDLKAVKIISLPATNPFAAGNNGQFPSGSRNTVATLKVDHRFNDRNSLFVRWAHDQQNAERTGNTTSDSRQVNDYSHMHSIIVENNAVLPGNNVNSLRFQFMNHDLGTVPNSFDLSIARPSASFGQDTTVPQDFPRKRYQIFDTFYINTARHDLKFGGDFEYAHHEYDAHFFQAGYFQFTTDLPFDASNSKTYPISFTMQTPGGIIPIRTRLTGRVNVQNLLAAAAAGLARGLTPQQVAEGARALACVPGRFQTVDQGQPFTVVVDYAHTDDALRNLTALAREFVESSGGRVITLFGCGGDRDRTKRPLMGVAAGEGSDLVVLTSDNPRSEEPGAILEDVLPGLKQTGVKFLAEPDRARAIYLALSAATAGDIVLLAGKGHEKVQVLAGGAVPFEDAAVAAQVLAELGYIPEAVHR